MKLMSCCAYHVYCLFSCDTNVVRLQIVYWSFDDFVVGVVRLCLFADVECASFVALM